jgi:hypothetical protein
MKKKTSIMLSARDKKLLELLAKKEARSQTAEIEYLIRRRAMGLIYHHSELFQKAVFAADEK